MTEVEELINQVWNEYSSANGKIKSVDLIKVYSKLYEMLNVPTEGSLPVLQEFISSNPRLSLTKADIDYLHQRLLGETIEQLVERNKLDKIDDNEDGEQTSSDKNDDDDDDDACQIFYSPHKKTQKIVPIFEDGNKDIARNLFDAEPKTENDDLTRDIFNDNKLIPTERKSSLKTTNLVRELDEKRSRIADLEQVLVEMQDYISKLNNYNDKEMVKIRSKYETKISNCELKINEINKSIKELNLELSSRNTKSKLQVFNKLKLFISFWVEVVLTHKIFVFSLVIAGIIYLNLDKIESTILTLVKYLVYMFGRLGEVYYINDQEQALDKTLKEFSHLLEIMN